MNHGKFYRQNVATTTLLDIEQDAVEEEEERKMSVGSFGNYTGPPSFGNNSGPNSFGNNSGPNSFGNNSGHNSLGNDDSVTDNNGSYNFSQLSQ